MYLQSLIKKYRSKIISVTFAMWLVASPFAGLGLVHADSQWPKMVSASNTGEPGNLSSATTSFDAVQISKDGRYVAFLSEATNLGAPDGGYVVYVRDLQTDTTVVGSIGTQGQIISPSQSDFSLSGNGQYLAFSGEGGIDVRDLQNNTTVNVYENGGVSRPSISDDGTVLAFTFRLEQQDYFEARNLVTGQTWGWSNGEGSTPLISGDGRYVTYTTSCCSNQIYRYDLSTSSQVLVSASPDGTPGNASSHLRAISGDGNYVMFYTAATNISPDGTAGSYRKDMRTGDVVKYGVNDLGGGINSVSSDGNILVYGGDCQTADSVGVPAVCIYNFSTGQHTAVSRNKWGAVSTAGGGTEPVINQDGTMVAFSTWSADQYGFPGVSAMQVFAEPTAAFATLTDTNAPALGQIAWTANPAKVADNNPFSISASDSESGVRRVAYTVDGSIPGPSNPGEAMYYADGVYTGYTVASKPGVYQVTISAEDNAGNWSDPVVDYLVLYDPTDTRMRGQGSVLPVYGTDVLPGLAAANQPNKVKFGFLVAYKPNGTINKTKSVLSVTYSTGTKCGKPAANNCHVMALNSTSIDWLVVTGDNSTNNSQGEFRGTANFNLDGTTTVNPFRVVGLDGALNSPVVPDRFTLDVYAPGANTNTATPIYQVSGALFRGNVKVTAPPYGNGGGNQ